MAYTVDTSFASFHSDKVNLNPDRNKRARLSRDYLVKQLDLLQDKEPTFPISYSEKHINYGSFARRTKIRELDDVDMIYCMSSTGATYLKDYSYQNTYDISTANAGQILRRLADTNYKLNSNAVINEVKSCLKDVENYSGADIHKKHEAVTLKLLTYEWNFDMLPAFFTDTEFYLIPDGNGRWKATNPNIDQERSTRVNQQHDGKILQIIRTMKYWSRYKFGDIIPSYLLENFIINYFETRYSLTEYIDHSLRDFWLYLSTQIYQPVYDPKGFDGNINSLSSLEKSAISLAASDAYNISVQALSVETMSQKDAIERWSKIFGSEFPAYG